MSGAPAVGGGEGASGGRAPGAGAAPGPTAGASGAGGGARVLDGQAIAAELAATLGERAGALRRRGIVPALAVVGAGDDPAARSYARVLERGAVRVGAELRAHQLDPTAGADELAARLDELNADRRVHGVLL